MINSGTKRIAHQCIVSVAVAILLLLAPVALTRGQVVDSNCTYARCGLSIVPRLSGLDVVRGATEAPIGSLPFLWSRDVSAAFTRDTAARSYAVRATGRRRIAAVMTDLGAILAVVGAAGVFRDGGRVRGRASVAAASGVALVAASIPVHFSADADLSRAVWRYNAVLAVTQDR